MIEQIISGGQTGVDQVALIVAEALGIRTGGTAPKGWRTDDGPAPWLGTRFGLVESYDAGYVVRTVKNVRDADMTVWFGDVTSPGGRLTKKIARIEQVYNTKRKYHWLENPTVDDLTVYFGSLFNVKILNVAGNRLRTNPAATALACEILTKALRS